MSYSLTGFQSMVRGAINASLILIDRRLPSVPVTGCRASCRSWAHHRSRYRPRMGWCCRCHWSSGNTKCM